MFKKVTLKMEDGFFGNFQLPNQESLVVPILNLSSGGLNFAVPPKKQNHLKDGDHLKLVCIAGTANLNFISDIPAQIVAIGKRRHENHVSAVCKFLSLVDETREQIIRLIDHECKMRGQYV